MSESDIAQFIAPHGDIDTIKIIRDRQTKICKGYAFVEMKTEEGALLAVDALNGNEADGRQLAVSIVEEQQSPISSNQRPIRSSGKSKSFHVSEEHSKRPRRPRD